MQGNIQTLTPKQLDSYKADMWLLSPPCQPYTRRGLKKHENDGRAASFLDLLERIPRLTCKPQILLVENVVGFEGSETRARLVAMLREQGYSFQVQGDARRMRGS